MTRRQLLEAGLSSGAIGHRLAHGRLHPVHRGVYLVGHPVAPPGARELAGVLACGSGAVVSHRSAAVIFGLERERDGEPLELSVGRRTAVVRPGLRVHRRLRLDPEDTTIRSGIPVTSLSRTLLDRAAAVSTGELERLVARSEVELGLGRQQLDRYARSANGTPGARRLVALLDAEAGPSFTRSEAERRFLTVVREAGLASPRCNVGLVGFEVDFLWPGARLVVEVDGYAFHSSRRAFESDHDRDLVLEDAGYRVRRFTWRQITETPLLVAARLATALAA